MSKLKLAAAMFSVAALSAAPAFAGNGLGVNGAHYNLNIIGKTNCGITAEGSSGHVIEVLLKFSDGSQNGQAATTLNKINKIFLSPGDFAVTDPNGCDQNGASFTLPSGGYTVWARALGKPGGAADMTLCATDTVDNTLVCNTSPDIVSMTRNNGKPVFTNVTTELTTLTVAGTSYNLFDPTFQGYFWDYDNYGLRLLQLRFYPD